MTEKPPLKYLSPQDWELLIEDFQYDVVRREKWTSHYSPLSILDLALSSILRKDFPLKLSLISFLEEFSDSLFRNFEVQLALDRLIDAVRSVVQAPHDAVSFSSALKERMVVAVTSILICIGNDVEVCLGQLESLVELLLTIVNRPSHGADRQMRAVACECLRELERAFPCLLAEIAGHIWGLCQSERTHASQSYILLFTLVIHNIVTRKVNVSILNTSVPLVPFNVPQFVVGGSSRERDDGVYVVGDAGGVGVGVAGIDVEDAFDGQEASIARRLVLISREAQLPLVFRLLALHWLLGFIGLVPDSGGRKKQSIVEIGLGFFYPSVFDPLALKSLKLDLLAFCAICLNTLSADNMGGGSSEVAGPRVSVVKLFEDGLVSVSAFKWLPPWSTETAVAFRTFHKFLIGARSHSDTDSSTNRTLMESTIFHTLEVLSGSFLFLPLETCLITNFINHFGGLSTLTLVTTGTTMDEKSAEWMVLFKASIIMPLKVLANPV
ncbi:hypothetical protein CK203_092914 [Vitis vinifera]|uniref:Uncharacterized protein n=1 Tax=Vitis vinifera TaxID=29760 RepID=A0A438EJE8_VITVI|nr:hypothetical protein CK203_092914 [Vitis vinifera]